jgi:hypothetical protein
MRISLSQWAALLLGLPGWFTAAVAHPGSGIVVDDQGQVYFQDTVARKVWKIGADGRTNVYYSVSGGHWMCLDWAGSFAVTPPKHYFDRISPAGVKPAMIFADGGAPIAVCADGNLYYGSAFPGGADTAPGGLTVTRMTRDGKLELFSAELKALLAKWDEGVTGLAAGPGGLLYVATPASLLKVKLDGSVTTLVHPLVVPDGATDLPPRKRGTFAHSPQLRGLDVAGDGTVYAAATAVRSVVKVSAEGKVANILRAETPWSPTGVALHKGDLFVLEYTNADGSPHDTWQPRVRKLTPDGNVSTLVTLPPEGRALPRP